MLSFMEFIELRAHIRLDLMHYEFMNFEPVEDEHGHLTISIEEFLQSCIKSVAGSKRERCKKQICKVAKVIPNARVSF